jgi:mono/diheme cytochrome c family protein
MLVATNAGDDPGGEIVTAGRDGGRRVRAVLLGALVGLISSAGADAAAPGDPERGKPLYGRYCRGCHGEDGRGGAHTFMPHVETLTKKGYIELVPDEYLFGVINEGGLSVGKSSYMPAWGQKLKPQEIWDIVAFIRTLPIY